MEAFLKQFVLMFYEQTFIFFWMKYNNDHFKVSAQRINYFIDCA